MLTNASDPFLVRCRSSRHTPRLETSRIDLGLILIPRRRRRGSSLTTFPVREASRDL